MKEFEILKLGFNFQDFKYNNNFKRFEIKKEKSIKFITEYLIYPQFNLQSNLLNPKKMKMCTVENKERRNSYLTM